MHYITHKTVPTAAWVLALGIASIVLLTLVVWAERGTQSALIADAASVDYFLKIDGIPGESTDTKHKNWIELESWSWGMSQPSASSGGGGGAGRVVIHDIIVTKAVDKATPKLMLACAKGEHIRNVELTLHKSGKEQQDYYTITLENVACTSFAQSGQNGASPTESVSFSFGKIKTKYQTQGTAGTPSETIEGGWDVTENREY